MEVENLEQSQLSQEQGEGLENRELETLKQENASLREQLQDTNSKLLDIDAKLSDPNYLRTISSQGREEEDPEPQFEDLDTENMTSSEVLAEMERRQRVRMEWQQKQTDKRFKAREEQERLAQQNAAREQEAAHIREFVSKTSDFGEYQEDVRSLYGAQLSIEDAYEYAKLKKIARDVESGARHPRRQPMKSSRSADNRSVEKTFDTVRDGAKAALDEVLNNGGTLDPE